MSSIRHFELSISNLAFFFGTGSCACVDAHFSVTQAVVAQRLSIFETNGTRNSQTFFAVFDIFPFS